MGQNKSYKKTTLPNGIRVITEHMPGVRSISLGVWVWSGTRYESENQGGIAHFLEHMFFKGTKTRTPFEIAQSIESLGGYINAFTGRELNCYFVRIRDDHLPKAVNVLGDILINSTFNPVEIEKEKGVVIEEIHGQEDNPEDIANELFSSIVWAPHPLSRPILGSIQTVESFNREDILNYLTDRYQNDQVYVVAAGHINHENLVELVTKQYNFPMKKKPARRNTLPTKKSERVSVKTTNHAQVHLCLGGIGLSYYDSRKYALYVLNTALGGGMTSRLFQKIREDAGLAYAIYSDIDVCLDSGLFCISAGSDPTDIPRVLKMIINECKSIVSDSISHQELKDSKSQLIGSMYLSLEGSNNVMNRLARMAMYDDQYIPIEETVSKIDQVTSSDIQSLAEEIFCPENLHLTAVGPISQDALSL